MSMYFDVGDETLWNPSNGAGRLFLRHIEIYEAELGLPSGIGQGRHWGDPDTLEVDPVAYEEFVRGLVAWHRGQSHSVLRTLSEGFAATALALARRAGIDGEPPAPQTAHAPDGARHDHQVPAGPRTTPSAVPEALDARARELDRRMPR
ncbi:DUF6086 family protein [Streptomyces sp. NPDC055060]